MAELIKITYPDGEEICYKSPVHTVIAVLRKIGIERFPEITFETGNYPLVSQEIHLKKYTKDILPGWYYINRSDTREKTNQLINLNRQFDLGLKIEVGEGFKAQKDPVQKSSTRPKHRLKVTLPDGEIIDYDGFRDVFMACIDKLGPRLISSKANIDLNRNCSLLTTTDTGGRRKVAEHLYLAIPFTAKESAKILDLIAKRLGIQGQMKIEFLPMRSLDSNNSK